MNQAEVSKLVSKLKVKVNPRLRKFRTPGGPEERLNTLRKTVTALIKYERIELNYPRADESRLYAERLISDAIRHGDCHKTTMEMADYWLIEKQLVHKLFKVLVPRFKDYNISYTRMYKVPNDYENDLKDAYRKAVLELRGNPFPSLQPDTYTNRNLIHNVLLDEAKRDYRMRKYAEVAERIEKAASEISEIKLDSDEKSEIDTNTDVKNTQKWK